jgi:hypothetical protein
LETAACAVSEQKKAPAAYAAKTVIPARGTGEAAIVPARGIEEIDVVPFNRTISPFFELALFR